MSPSPQKGIRPLAALEGQPGALLGEAEAFEEIADPLAEAVTPAGGCENRGHDGSAAPASFPAGLYGRRV